jgi:hypothetical protein
LYLNIILCWKKYEINRERERERKKKERDRENNKKLFAV